MPADHKVSQCGDATTKLGNQHLNPLMVVEVTGFLAGEIRTPIHFGGIAEFHTLLPKLPDR